MELLLEVLLLECGVEWVVVEPVVQRMQLLVEQMVILLHGEVEVEVEEKIQV